MAQRGIETFAISAATGEGVQTLLRAVAAGLARIPRDQPVPAAELPVIRPPEDENVFEITREDNAFRVTGTKVERVIAMTNFDQDEGILRLHRVLQAMGITCSA